LKLLYEKCFLLVVNRFDRRKVKVFLIEELIVKQTINKI